MMMMMLLTVLMVLMTWQTETDDRKRKYNSMASVEVTKEDIEVRPRDQHYSTWAEESRLCHDVQLTYEI